LAIERESLRNVIKQKDVFENNLKECKDELEKARLSNSYLQKEVQQLAEELSSAKLRERALSIEENSWMRVDKPRLENQVINLQAELAAQRSEINRVRTLSDENSQQRVNQLKEELRLKEVLLLRERAEKDAALLELSVTNNTLKEDLQRVLVSSKHAERLNNLNLENTSRLEAEIKRLKQIQENLQDERNRLIETLESHQSKQMQYPQLIQGESNYSSIEMLSPSSNREAGSKNVPAFTESQKIRELNARCQELSALLDANTAEKQQRSKESKEVDGLKAALKEMHGQHMAKLESLTANHNLERQKDQKQILAFAGRINELEYLVQEKEQERKKAVLEMQGFKSALQQR